MTTTMFLFKVSLLLLILFFSSITNGFQVQICRSGIEATISKTRMHAVGYEPKWAKKETLADSIGPVDQKQKGLVGQINVIFRQGNETKTTLAMPGEPVSFIASQAGQPIRYGCKKGECGTCEAKCNGKWIRPCVETIPNLPNGEDYIIELKELKSKTTKSGKFFSVRSFIMGFYNNLLGMVGFVKQRRAAKRNFDERIEFEELIRKRALEKKKSREQLKP